MTDPRDLQVAETLEKKPEEFPKFNSWPHPQLSEVGAWRVYHNQKGAYWKPRPFITAPTWELKGIVKAWIAEQDYELRVQIVEAIMAIWQKRSKMKPLRTADAILHQMIEYEKLGDWGSALLATKGKENETQSN